MEFIPIPDTLIALVNTLGGNQHKILTFTDRHSRLIGKLETSGVSAYSDEVSVEIPVVDSEIDEKELEMPAMEPDGNVDLSGVDTKGQYDPLKVVDIDDPDIPQDPSLIVPETALEVPSNPEGTTLVSTPDTEGPHISTIVL